MADEADTDRSGHVRNGRLLFHHIKGFFLRFKAKKIVKWQQPRWLAMSTPEVATMVVAGFQGEVTGLVRFGLVPMLNPLWVSWVSFFDSMPANSIFLVKTLWFS